MRFAYIYCGEEIARIRLVIRVKKIPECTSVNNNLPRREEGAPLPRFAACLRFECIRARAKPENRIPARNARWLMRNLYKARRRRATVAWARIPGVLRECFAGFPVLAFSLIMVTLSVKGRFDETSTIWCHRKRDWLINRFKNAPIGDSANFFYAVSLNRRKCLICCLCY